MKSGAYDYIAGAFAHQEAPFAVHPLDRARAAQYLHQAVMQGLTWDEAASDIRAYLTGRELTAEAIEAEINRAQPLLRPWLA